MRALLAVTGITVRSALRRPAPYVLAILGCLALWGGVSLEILALGNGSRVLELGIGTAEGVSLVLAALLVPGVMAQDDRSGWGAALAASTAGDAWRLTGRFLGSWALCVLGGAPALLVALYKDKGDVALDPSWAAALPLEVGATCAWALWLARLLPPAGATLATLGVLALARMGVPPALAAALPLPLDPRAGVAATALGVEALATAGLLCAALATRAPSEDG